MKKVLVISLIFLSVITSISLCMGFSKIFKVSEDDTNIYCDLIISCTNKDIDFKEIELTFKPQDQGLIVNTYYLDKKGTKRVYCLTSGTYEYEAYISKYGSIFGNVKVDNSNIGTIQNVELTFEYYCVFEFHGKSLSASQYISLIDEKGVTYRTIDSIDNSGWVTYNLSVGNYIYAYKEPDHIWSMDNINIVSSDMGESKYIDLHSATYRTFTFSLLTLFTDFEVDVEILDPEYNAVNISSVVGYTCTLTRYNDKDSYGVYTYIIKRSGYQDIVGTFDFVDCGYSEQKLELYADKLDWIPLSE